MFENLKIIGEAFKSFGKKDDEVEIDQRSSIEKLDDFNMEDDIFSATQSEESKDIQSIDDTSTTESIKDVLIKEEKEKLADKEDSLDKKLRNIEKVIGAFSEAPEQADIPKQDTGSASDNINLKPIDMGSVQAKELINEYLKPSVNSDRVGLLYENLRKLNLI
jgi:hypothetical protein